MEQFKKLLKHLLYPHPALFILLVPASVGLLIYAFAHPQALEQVSYLAYFLSAYTLTVLCMRTPDIVRFIGRLKKENKYLKRYFNEPQLRINISLYGSLIFNAAYAVFQLVLGFYHHTVWYYSFAGYYAVLAIMRFFLLRHTRTHEQSKNRARETRIYRLCGWLLLLTDAMLAVVINYIVLQKKVFIHHEITTIALAAFTFTSLTMAIISLVRYRKYENPIFSAAKAIGLACALVSMLILESSMLTAFGDGTQENFRLIIMAASGLAITLFIFGMAVSMIVKSTKQLNSSEDLKDE